MVLRRGLLGGATSARRSLLAGGGGAFRTGVYGTLRVTTLLQDTFTDTDGTALNVHTMTIGSGWTNLAGTTFQINTNQCLNTRGAFSDSTNDPGWITADAGNANVTVSVQSKITESGFWLGPAFRVQNATNGWFILISDPSSYSLYEVSAGTLIQRATASPTINVGTYYTVKAVLAGTSITGFLDGVQQLTFTSATLQTQTKMGLACTGNNGTHNKFWDNFLVTSP